MNSSNPSKTIGPFDSAEDLKTLSSEIISTIDDYWNQFYAYWPHLNNAIKAAEAGEIEKCLQCTRAAIAQFQSPDTVSKGRSRRWPAVQTFIEDPNNILQRYEISEATREQIHQVLQPYLNYLVEPVSAVVSALEYVRQLVEFHTGEVVELASAHNKHTECCT